MPSNGGLTPGFERYGGGTPALKIIVDSLNSQRGTLYNDLQTSTVYLENMALGRAIAECWSNNARMANQWDVARMTEFIPRWEAILGLVPKDKDTYTARRARIANVFSRFTQANIYQSVRDLLVALLGSVFVQVTHTSVDQSVVFVPVGGVALNSSDADISQQDATGELTFYSTVCHLLIEVVQPVGYTDNDFYTAAALINAELDSMLPAWVTWDWARGTSHALLHSISIASSTNATPIVVTTVDPSIANVLRAGPQHGFVVGQTVTIADHLVNTNANGSWVVSAVGGTTAGDTGTTLTLTGSVGNGVGAATGTVSAPGFYLDGDPGVSGNISSTLVNLDNEAVL